MTTTPLPSPHAALPKTSARVVSRRYHPRSAGFLYILTTIVLVLGAINGQNNLLFFVFGLAVAGLAISGVLSGTPLMGLQISRQLPMQAAVGEPMTVRYSLHSRTRRLPCFGLWIDETFDHTGHAPAGCEHLPAGQSRSALTTIVPQRRGPFEFNRFRVSTVFPFGLARKSVSFSQPDRVWVRPAIWNSLPPIFRKSTGHQNAGPAIHTPRGGDEFYALREYIPGDTPRSIAWRPSARSNRLVVRQWSQTLARRAWIVLDVSMHATNPDAAERVISVAAGLVQQALNAGLDVGCAVRQGPILVTPRASANQLHRILDAFARLELDALPPAAQAQFAPKDALILVTAGQGLQPGFSAVVDVNTLAPQGGAA